MINNLDMDFREIFELSEKQSPGRIYLFSENNQVSFGDALRVTRNMFHWMRKNFSDLQNCTIGIRMRSSAELLFLILTCITYRISIKFIREKVSENKFQSDRMELVITDSDPENSQEKRFPDLDYFLNKEFEVFNCEKFSQESVYIFYSSGTTGKEKDFSICHSQIEKGVCSFLENGGLQYRANQVAYLTLPLFHSYGFSSLLEFTLAGSSIVLPKESALGSAFSLINCPQSGSITALEGVPFFYNQFLKLKDRVYLPSLRHAGTGSGNFPDAEMKILKAKFPQLSASARYGMTEAPSAISHKFFDDIANQNMKSSGRILPVFQYRIDADPPGDASILIRGETISNSITAEDVSEDGFFNTKDSGFINRDNELEITGRQSLFLKHLGYRFSPDSIESILHPLEFIADCKALNSGEELHLEIVGDQTKEKEILKLLSERLPSYAIPDEIYFSQSIPRTYNGKIIRTKQGGFLSK